MVTRSFGSKLLRACDYVKDGQVFTEIYQGEDDKNVFHKEILRAQSILGGMMYEF